MSLSKGAGSVCVPAGLNKTLRHYHSIKASIPQESARAQRDLVHKVTEGLLQYCKDNDRGICHFYHAGSAYDGLQVANSACNDFDVPIAMNGKKDLHVEKVTPGYARMKPMIHDDSRFEKYLDPAGYVHPEKIQTTKMYSLIHKGVNEQNLGFRRSGERIEVDPPIRHGPAIQLDVHKGSVNVSVDLVPSFKMSEHERYIAKPYKDYADEKPRLPAGVDPNTLWRQSFSVEEKAKLTGIDKDGGCRKQVVRTFKAMRNDDATLQGLTSYHLKTLVLHETDRLPRTSQWDQDRLGERFMGMMKSLETTLQPGGSLPNYFIPDLDLYDGMSDSKRANIRGRVGRLIRSEHELARVLRV